jgi:pimeloyl-ACP methyl ester carboxylesterase
MTTAATHHYAEIGLRYHYVEAGEGPAVLLLHGFPELWYSWRHQLGALASAGYRAIAPDLRGFGESEVTAEVRDYSLLQHARDVMSLLDAIGVEQAVVAGHDWGANLTWLLGLAYPERVRAIVSLSIPFYPKPRDPEQMRAWSEGKFDFMRYFQKPGAAEREFAEDPRKFFELFFYGLSGDAPEDTVDTLYLRKPPEAKLLDGFPKPAKLPAWLSEADLAYYVTAYERTGLTPALNFYRNVEQDYPGLKPHYERSLEQPVLFIGGAREAAVRFGNVEGMRAVLPNLRAIHILPDCGHWVQQERPGEVNAALLEFLSPGHPIA